MKAIIWTAYGAPDVLELRDISEPDPRETEVLIRVRAATVSTGDTEMRALKFPFYLALPIRLYAGFFKPNRMKMLGQDFAGEVVRTGSRVTSFKPGDRVFGTTGLMAGTNAELICLPEAPGDMGEVFTQMPEDLSFEQAAALPVGGLEALHFLKFARLQSGEHLLVYGAGGGIGTVAVQVARNIGTRVTAVDSGPKLGMLRSLGADHVIDYQKEDFTRLGEMYDVIFDVVGKSPFSRSLRSLNENGRYLIANPNLAMFFKKLFAFGKGGRRIYMQVASPKLKDLNELKDLAGSGVVKSVVDRVFPLDETVDAHRFVESGVKQGNVIITP